MIKNEILEKKEVSMRKLFNIIGIFIFGGLALTNVINPLPSSEQAKEFLIFITGSAIVYYILVSIYFFGGLWRKVFYASLILLSGVSLFMIFYLASNPIPH
ncbi:hypothetical protein [Qipengyuania zhejiangensis]|uniref:hypothetical protein n=1 Tax=Qipengyuania zhejiangensis TaxID=3077782 RepID=UPI002D77A50C|nr:hypothetical protein [Qipengyuania sp. Z2]